MNVKNIFVSFLAIAFATTITLTPSVAFAVGAPTVTRHFVPHSHVQFDGSVDVLLRLATNRPTEMHVMICEGTVLSGDIADCDWSVDTGVVRYHRMVMENLRANTTYSYRVQFIDALGGGVTAERTFLTP